jgi:hypothetical protein
VLRSLEAMPHPNVSRLMDSISGETNHLCSIHWFAHVA